MPDAFTKHVTPGSTPQTEQARPEQVPNSAGGYSFKVSDLAKLDRFLTIGTEGGTFYVDERKLTRDSAKFIAALAENSRPELIDRALEISEAGRAPRNNPALFAFAAAAGLGDVKYRQRALDLLPRVARTGTHFLTFTKYVEMFRGWGPQLVKGMRHWYTSKSPDDLAYQLLKYKQRDGWSHRDVLRLCARKSAADVIDAEHTALFEYVMKDAFNAELLPPLVDLAERMHETRNVGDWTRGITSNRSLSWEMLPSEALAEKAVWVALIENGNLPLGALLRNLSRLTKLGVLAPMGGYNETVLRRLTDAENVTRSRIHPIAVLTALKTYARGHGKDGRSTWVPVPQVIDALDQMFYMAFGNVVPANKRTVIALDVSGSMGAEAGGTGISCMEVATAMSMIVVKTEPQHAVMAFDNGIRPVNITARQRLDDAVNSLPRNYGGTDCSLPMLWATQQSLAVDNFIVYTDNETYAGRMHPHEALAQYRRHSGIEATMQVVGMTATDFTIADPKDPKTLDVAGFDAAVPNLLAAHARGDL